MRRVFAFGAASRTLGPGRGGAAGAQSQPLYMTEWTARPRARLTPLGIGVRASFVALLATAVAAPEIAGSYFSYPEVTSAWVLFVFGALFALGLVSVAPRRKGLALELLALLVPLVVPAFYSWSRPWITLLVYPPLAYLLWRMLRSARLLRPEPIVEHRAGRRALPVSWLAAGVLVLIGIHVSWALNARSPSDVGYAGVYGATRIIHGEPLYGSEQAQNRLLPDPHADTYGPLNYEAYVPPTLVTGAAQAAAAGPLAQTSSASAAARLTTLVFDLLTALLLFVLGRSVGAAGAGVALAFGWLAFPFTLYGQAFSFNDSIMVAALVGALLVASSPRRRGVAAALAACTKLVPLALVPLLASHGAAGRRRYGAFALGFALASLVVFAPVLAHFSPGAFASRTAGFQGGRSPSDSIWALFSSGYLGHAAWVTKSAEVVHGALIALSGGFVAALLWLRRREDLVGVASCAAAIMLAIVISSSVYASNYVLWFAPLVMVAALLGGVERSSDRAAGRSAAHAA